MKPIIKSSKLEMKLEIDEMFQGFVVDERRKSA